MDIGTLVMKVSADTKNFQTNMDKVKSTLGTASKVVAGATVAIAAGGAALFGMATKAGEATDRVDKMSQRLGMSRKSFQEWDYVLSQNGISIDSMQMGMKSLSQRMLESAEGAGKGADLFGKLGISAKDASGNFRNQEDVFKDTIIALQGMDDGIEKAAMAQDLFGRNGQELLPMLNTSKGSIDELMESARELGLVLGDDAIDAGVKLTDTMDSLKRSLGAVVTQVGVALMPIIQSFSEWVITNMPTIQKVFSTVFNVIQTVVTVAVNLFTTYLLPIIKNVYNFIVENLPTMQGVSENVFNGIVKVVQNLWNWFDKYLMPIYRMMYEWVVANMPLIKSTFESVFNGISAVVDSVWYLFKTYFLPLLQDFYVWVQDNMPAIQKGFEIALKAVGYAFDGLKIVIDTVIAIINFLAEKSQQASDAVQSAFTYMSDIITTKIDNIKKAIQAMVDFINKAITAVEKFLGLDAESKAAQKGYQSAPGSSKGTGTPSVPFRPSGTGTYMGMSVDDYNKAVGNVKSGQRAFGGSVMSGKSYLVGERGPETFTPSTNGTVSTGSNITINVNGSTDPNITANAIVRILRTQGVMA